MTPLDPSALFSAFASAFSQSNRLLNLNFSSASNIAEDVFLPRQLTGFEAISLPERILHYSSNIQAVV